MVKTTCNACNQLEITASIGRFLELKHNKQYDLHRCYMKALYQRSMVCITAYAYKLALVSLTIADVKFDPD